MNHIRFQRFNKFLDGHLDVAGALSAAGVVACIPAMQALIAREAKAGTIKKLTAGIYRRASERNFWNTRNS